MCDLSKSSDDGILHLWFIGTWTSLAYFHEKTQDSVQYPERRHSLVPVIIGQKVDPKLCVNLDNKFI